MKIVIAGASGLVGRALAPSLRGAGHEVRRLVRGRGVASPDEIAWDPAAGALDAAHLEGVDAFINLAGENVGERRWTTARRERIRLSRINGTRTLVAAIEQMARKPAVLVNASAIGFYGDRGDEVLTEASAAGRGFLSDVCRAWETQAEGAARVGVRTVLARFGLILTPQGGALAKMLPLFRLGLGGRMGSGRQWMSWMAIDDVLGGITHALNHDGCAGPMNFAAPEAVPNAEFAGVLGRVLRRPTLLPVPAWALRIAVGTALANEALLSSQRASPQRLSEAGYAFRHATLEAALRSALGGEKL